MGGWQPFLRVEAIAQCNMLSPFASVNVQLVTAFCAACYGSAKHANEMWGGCKLVGTSCFGYLASFLLDPHIWFHVLDN